MLKRVPQILKMLPKILKLFPNKPNNKKTKLMESESATFLFFIPNSL